MPRRSAFIVAIDGPAGAGKSTIAKQSAERLGFALVDTGAIYRSIALFAAENSLMEEEAIASVIPVLALRLDPPRILLGTRDITSAIRTPEMSKRASEVSALPRVRQELLPIQRRIALAATKGAVLEGRDIGTVVFPDAELKVFLTASLEERAIRRHKELCAAGREVELEEVKLDIAERDHRDEQRSTAPLRAAADAILIDTSKRTIPSLVDEIVARVEKLRKN